MFKRSSVLGRTALFALAATTFAAPAMADTTVAGKLTADNYFEVFYGIPNGPTYKANVSDGDGTRWNQMKDFKFSIKDEVIAHCDCRIAIAVWGDGRVAEGLHGYLQWGSNRVRTGSGSYTVSNSGMTAPVATNVVASNMAGPAATLNGYPWGNPMGADGQSRWIWDGSGSNGPGANHVRVFSVKCSDVVRSENRPRPSYNTGTVRRVAPAINVQPAIRPYYKQ